MATTNTMFTITDVGDLNGRNLVLNSHEEHSRTVPSSGANGVVPYYSYSDFASEFTHTKGQILTVSFDYETTGNTLSTGLIYVQHNESQIAPTAGSVIVNILDNPSGHYSKTFKVTANQSTSTNNTIRVYYKTCSPGTVIKIKNVKVETGDEETPWTPAPEDVVTAMDDAKAAQSTADGAVTAINNYIAGNEIVVGTQTAATNAWTGKAGFSELVNGQGIAYWLPYAGTSTAATLKLTLADNSETAAIPVYYKGTTRATTHFTAGTVVHLTYRENADVAGTTVEKGWWADASYDSGNTNYYDRIRLNNSIKAKSAISASYFIVSDDSGYFHLAGGSVFDITKPILWCSTAISAGGTGSNNYISLPSLTLRNNASGITLTANKTCYLVGTLAGKMFTVKSSGFFTSTVPTSDDGYYYISLGYLYSTYQIYLYPEHPIYKFVNGSFKSLNQVAYEASVTAESKNSVYYQTSAPTGKKVGDTWFDTANDYKIRRWDGSTWAAAELGNQAVGNLDASHINTGTLTAVHIEAGKAQDIAGTIKVYDENDAVKVSLDKDGLIATKGTIGGWTIDADGIESRVLDQIGNTSSLIRLDIPNNSLITVGTNHRGVSIANGTISAYSTSHSIDTSSVDITFNGITVDSNNLTLGYTTMFYDDIVYYSDIPSFPFSNGQHFMKWSVLSPERAVKDTFKVTVYHCGNLFWAHFTGRMTVGLNGNQSAYIPIISNDDENLTKSKYCAPSVHIDKYIQSQEPANPRAIIRVWSNGTLGLYHFIKPTTGVNNFTVTIDTNWEECDIFWARVG